MTVPTTSTLATARMNPKSKKFSRLVRRALFGNPQAAFGTVVLVILLIVAVGGEALSPYSARSASGLPFEPPSWAHLLGTDDGGVDMLALVLTGARVSLIVGLSAAAISIVVGSVVGTIAGYYGGATEAIISRVVDYVLVVPALPLMIIFATLFGQSLVIIIAIIGILGWPTAARLVQAQVRSLKERQFVRRATAIGAGDMYIIVRHIVPQMWSLLIASFVLVIGYAVFTETFIAFVGLGDPTTNSWGRTIQSGFAGGAMSASAWWAIVPAGLCVTILVLASSMLGRSIEDALSPQAGREHLDYRRRKAGMGKVSR